MKTFSAGSTFDELLDTASRPDPYPLFERFAAQPVQQVEEHRWVVSTHADITRLLRDPRLSANDDKVTGAEPRPVMTGPDGEPFGGPLLSQDSPGHDHLRGLVVRQFMPRVMGMRDHLETLVTGLLDAHLSAGPGQLDVVADLAYPLPVAVICELLGVPPEDEPIFHDFAGKLTRGLDPEDSLTEQERHDIAIARNEFRAYLAPLIHDRQLHPGDDLLSGLLSNDDPEGRMNLLDLNVTLGLLLIAGHETTVNLIANGTLALLRHPDALARLRANPDLAPSLVEEVLRFDPPVQLTGRAALADIDVAGVTIPRGDKVTLLIAAGNRDPLRFDDPDRFWPERPNNAHLGFGGGVHYCLGAGLARMEAQLMLTAIARRLDNPRPIADPPPYRPNMILRGPEKLLVAFDRLGE
jgi:cytochrome P450